MSNKNLRLAVSRWLLIVAMAMPPSNIAWAGSKFKVLYSFQGGDDGAGVHAGLVADAKGNLYGTTGGGGLYSSGTAFKLTHHPDGTWTEKVLHSFNFHDDGAGPEAALVLDIHGNVYGTTVTGGANGAGSVFELSHRPGGWTETKLYQFCSLPDCADGGASKASLILDNQGGGVGVGVVFELTPGPNGWAENILHNFCTDPDCLDGYDPFANLAWDAKGNLYGTTWKGGKFSAGTLFKLRPNPDGSWKAHVLHSFGGSDKDGRGPTAGLVLESEGTIYGTTEDGGSHTCGQAGCGTVFKLTAQPDGRWKEVILHNFAPGKGGSFPSGGVLFDPAGNVYGTTSLGGDSRCQCGVVYRLSPLPDGTWVYSVLHRFTGADGYVPLGDLVLGKNGYLYGTAELGGAQNYGLVFELVP